MGAGKEKKARKMGWGQRAEQKPKTKPCIVCGRPMMWAKYGHKGMKFVCDCGVIEEG